MVALFKIPKIRKSISLKTSLLLKPVLPKFLTVSILFHFTTIKLQLEDRKCEGNRITCNTFRLRRLRGKSGHPT